ncbi:ATP synthase mitochondrial F1 complex assembly factor 1 [Desmophyllum pertusum]|uniref:ATP synthase mitochondrial F1 complex assembly factor 1 n=1 Tax=Desmophyllum pertusum TaxID=174260 RepID=A0A9W9YM44_9CNID|nr:ATP synthase mitochondrial F1 complex assembly factor 1 [Desmophyllum pertusum]
MCRKKYDLERIKKVKNEIKEGRLEDKSVEEKFRLDAEMREEAERFKKKVQQKAADSSLLGSNPLSSRGEASAYGQKTLNTIMHLDKIADKSAEEIGQIWREHHKDKDCISAVIPSNLYDRMEERFLKFPLFIYPLPREQGYEFMYAEFKDHKCYFTSLLHYQTRGENSPWSLAMKHFTELRDSKGIVLMVGEVDTNEMSVLDAQWVAYQVQMYYASEDDRREQILKTFNIFPDKFSHMTVVQELNAEIESGVMTGSLKENE